MIAPLAFCQPQLAREFIPPPANFVLTGAPTASEARLFACPIEHRVIGQLDRGILAPTGGFSISIE
jgi:hypothetical protein